MERSRHRIEISTCARARRPKGAITLAGLLVLALVAPGAQAASIDESVDGDISSLINAPTVLNLDLGSNLVTANSGSQGTTGGATNGSDAEFLTIVVGAGLVLDSLTVISRVGPGIQSFIGWNVGAALSGQSSGDLFDGALFRSGTELFSGASASFTDQSLGVDLLGPGTYAFWIQETAGAVDYTLDFNVVPEPGTGLLVAMGLAGLARRGRKQG